MRTKACVDEGQDLNNDRAINEMSENPSCMSLEADKTENGVWEVEATLL